MTDTCWSSVVTAVAFVHGVESGRENVSLSQGLAPVSSRLCCLHTPLPRSPPRSVGFLGCCPDPPGVVRVEHAGSSSAGGVLGVLLVAKSLAADGVLRGCP